MELDIDLLASIASGGLGSWRQDASGRATYVKSEDCEGEGGLGGERAQRHARWRRPTANAAARPPPTAHPPPRAPRALACLRDLQRFLRADDQEERPAFFAVHAKRLARSDLVPLVVTYPEDYGVVYSAREFGWFAGRRACVRACVRALGGGGAGHARKHGHQSRAPRCSA